MRRQNLSVRDERQGMRQSFEYLNPLVRDPRELAQYSGGLANLLRNSTRKTPSRKLDRLSAVSLGDCPLPGSSADFESQSKAFKLATIFQYQQKRQFCQIRAIIQKKFLNPSLERQSENLDVEGAIDQSKKKQLEKLLTTAPERDLGETCDHDVHKHAEFEVHLNEQFRKHRRQLRALKCKKIDKRAVFDRIQKEELERRALQLRKAKQKANFIRQRRPQFLKPLLMVSTFPGLDETEQKEEVDMEALRSHHDGVFAKICLMQKNKNDEFLDEDELDAKALLATGQSPPSKTVDLGNANPSQFANFSINHSVDISRDLYRELVEQEALSRGYEIREDEIDEIVQDLADGGSFNVNFDQIEDTYELLQSQNLFKLKELRRQQEQQKDDKREAKIKDAEMRTRYGRRAKEPVAKKKEKTQGDIVLKACKRSLSNQVHNDTGFEQDRRDDFLVASLKEQESILQGIANKQEYYRDVKKGVNNPGAVDSICLKYYTDVSESKIGLVPKIEQPSSLVRYDLGKLGSIRPGATLGARPHFCNIINGVLNLTNTGIKIQECEALGRYLQNAVLADQDKSTQLNNEIRVLLIDDFHFTDQMLHAILQGIQSQNGKLEQLIYINGELGKESIEFMCNSFFRCQKKLQQISFTNLRNQGINRVLYEELLESVSTLKLRSFRFTSMSILKEESVFQYLEDIIQNLQDLDLSWSSLKYSQFLQLGEALLDSSFLRSVNLSYLSVSNISNSEQKGAHIDQFIKHLAAFIAGSPLLMHLNLNSMDLSEAQILEVVNDGILRSKTLVGVHLTGNQIRIGSELRARVCSLLGISLSRKMTNHERMPLDHPEAETRAERRQSQREERRQSKQLQAAKRQGLDAPGSPSAHRSPRRAEQRIPNVRELLETGVFSIDIVNQGILALFKQDRQIHQASVAGSWSGCGIHGGDRHSLKQPCLSMAESFVIYRVLGHAELIFSGSPALTDERWHITSGLIEDAGLKEGLKDECYFCGKHKYVQVYYSTADRHKYYEQITNKHTLDQLKRSFDKDIQAATTPLILTTMVDGQDAMPVKMIDVKLVALYILQDLVLEANAKHTSIHVLKKNMKKEVLRYIRGSCTNQAFRAQLEEYVSQYMINWRTTFHQYLKYTNQYDCTYVAYPVSRTLMAEGFQDYEHKLDRMRDVHQKIRKDRVDVEKDDSDEEGTSDRVLTPRRNQSSLAAPSQKPRVVQFAMADSHITSGPRGKMEEASSDSETSSNSSSTSSFSNRGSSKIQPVSLGDISQSAQESDLEQTFVFMTFSKPGCHSIIIFDPLTKEFFKKVQVINYRNDDPDAHSVEELELDYHPTLVKSPSIRRQRDNLKKLRSLGEKMKQGVRREFFTVKPTVSATSVIVPNYQQVNFSQQILQEEVNQLQPLAGSSSKSPKHLQQNDVQKQTPGKADFSERSSQQKHKVEQEKAFKEKLSNNFEFFVNLFQLLKIQDKVPEYIYQTLDLIKPLVRCQPTNKQISPAVLQQKQGDPPALVFTRPDFLNRTKDPEGMIKGMKQAHPKLYDFIMFRKHYMSPKKVGLHRCLRENIQIVDLLYQIYTPRSINKDYNVIRFLQDVEQAFAEDRKRKRDEPEIGSPSGLSSKMRADLNGMDLPQLVEYCRVEPSLRQQSDDVRNVSEADVGRLKQLEFVELICRVAFILEIRPKDLLKDVLVRVLVEKHKEAWRVTPDIEGRIHELLPKKMQLPYYRELPKLAAENPIISQRSAYNVHDGSHASQSGRFSIGPNATAPPKPSAGALECRSSAPQLPTMTIPQWSGLLNDPRAGPTSKVDQWHVKNIHPLTSSVKAMLNDISENEESEEHE